MKKKSKRWIVLTVVAILRASPSCAVQIGQHDCVEGMAICCGPQSNPTWARVRWLLRNGRSGGFQWKPVGIVTPQGGDMACVRGPLGAYESPKAIRKSKKGRALCSASSLGFWIPCHSVEQYQRHAAPPRPRSGFNPRHPLPASGHKQTTTLVILHCPALSCDSTGGAARGMSSGSGRSLRGIHPIADTEIRVRLAPVSWW